MKPISGKRMCRILDGRGWIHEKTKGSHFHFRHPDHPGDLIQVPVHANRDMRHGTQHEIMKQAGLTDGDL